MAKRTWFARISLGKLLSITVRIFAKVIDRTNNTLGEKLKWQESTRAVETTHGVEDRCGEGIKTYLVVVGN